MELDELADKTEMDVEVLGKPGSLPSQHRFPRDEAVLARFGKQQQFRVSLIPVSIFLYQFAKTVTFVRLKKKLKN